MSEDLGPYSALAKALARTVALIAVMFYSVFYPAWFYLVLAVLIGEVIRILITIYISDGRVSSASVLDLTFLFSDLVVMSRLISCLLHHCLLLLRLNIHVTSAGTSHSLTMHLTLHLLKHPYVRNVQLGRLRKHIGGAVTIGKHKIFSPICPWDKHAAMDHLISDQKNLEVLSRPFITPEQQGPKGAAKVSP